MRTVYQSLILGERAELQQYGEQQEDTFEDCISIANIGGEGRTPTVIGTMNKSSCYATVPWGLFISHLVAPFPNLPGNSTSCGPVLRD